jgi:hypothetical protein
VVPARRVTPPCRPFVGHSADGACLYCASASHGEISPHTARLLGARTNWKEKIPKHLGANRKLKSRGTEKIGILVNRSPVMGTTIFMVCFITKDCNKSERYCLADQRVKGQWVFVVRWGWALQSGGSREREKQQKNC